MNEKSNENKGLRIFSQKAEEHTENTEIKVNIDIFYELFRSFISQRIGRICQGGTYGLEADCEQCNR